MPILFPYAGLVLLEPGKEMDCRNKISRARAEVLFAGESGFVLLKLGGDMVWLARDKPNG